MKNINQFIVTPWGTLVFVFVMVLLGEIISSEANIFEVLSNWKMYVSPAVLAVFKTVWNWGNKHDSRFGDKPGPDPIKPQ